MFTVYVLRNPEGRLYIGHSAHLDRRLREHDAGLARWTKERGPWRLAHKETFATRAEAIQRERQLKRGRLNQQLRRLIDSSFV